MKQNSILTGLKESKELNLRNNFEYIDAYSDYVKKTDNKTWSREQKRFLDILYAKKRRSKKNNFNSSVALHDPLGLSYKSRR